MRLMAVLDRSGDEGLARLAPSLFPVFFFGSGHRAVLIAGVARATAMEIERCGDQRRSRGGEREISRSRERDIKNDNHTRAGFAFYIVSLYGSLLLCSTPEYATFFSFLCACRQSWF